VEPSSASNFVDMGPAVRIAGGISAHNGGIAGNVEWTSIAEAAGAVHDGFQVAFLLKIDQDSGGSNLRRMNGDGLCSRLIRRPD